MMTKDKIEKFIFDLVRVCVKHDLIVSSDTILKIQKPTSQLVQNLKDAEVDLDLDEDDEQKNPKKKYKFYKPKTVKKVENKNPKKKFKFYEPDKSE